jgi:cytidylate kinase
MEMNELMNAKVNHDKTDEEIFREIAEEEGMTVEEVKEMWETFIGVVKDANAKNKKKAPDRAKKKKARKQAKASKKRNR